MDLSLADRVHNNLMEVNSWMADASGGALHFENGELLFASRSPIPFLNGVMRERSTVEAGDLLRSARSFFFERDRGFIVFAWPGDPEIEVAARTAGMFPVLEHFPEMVCRAPLTELAGDLRPVETPTDADAYWAICDAAYPSLGFPPGLFKEAFEADDLLDKQRVWACLAYEDGRAVACASVWMTSGVGMVGWVASLPETRGRGLAAACTVRVTNHALEHGADVASLQASPMGEDIYRRLGYEEIFSYRLLGAMPG
jgi:ribosomal protein S18 acetylase RimI-like enzyme